MSKRPRPKAPRTPVKPAVSPLSTLVELPDSVLWSSRTWTDFAALRQPGKHLALLPVFGFADWGLGRPLDLEETLGAAVLREALAVPSTAALPLHVLPPLRWVLGPYPHTMFGIDWETALDLLHELATGVHRAGLRKLVLFTTSPWNEELIQAAGRSIREKLGLHVFLLRLGALELDLHPVRSTSRVAVQCAACACYQSLPIEEQPQAEITWTQLRPGHVREPGGVPFDLALDDARSRGTALLAQTGQRVAALLAEMHAHPSTDPAARRRREPQARGPRQARRGGTRR